MASKEGDQKKVEASFIINFYEECVMLNNNYALYVNALVEIQQKQEGLEEHEKIQLKQIVQNVRFYCNTLYIKYLSLLKVSGKTESKEMKKAHDHINKVYMIERTELVNFIQGLNDLLIEDIMQHLLDSSKDVLKMYNDD